MKTTLQGKPDMIGTWSLFHPINAQDTAAMVAMRAIVEPNKGRLQGTAARVPFDGIMEGVPAPEGVTYETGHAGGIPGVWRRPENARPEEVRAPLTLSAIWRDISQPRQAYRHLCPTTGSPRSIHSQKSPSLAIQPVEPWLSVSSPS